MTTTLVRRLGFVQATALNMIDMVGIGPFVTLALVVKYMNGPQAIVAWLAGALLAFVDSFVWSELGAAMPKAGGSYVFLREAFGPARWGRLFSFLFLWQTTIQAPLVVASGALGFADYFGYLWVRINGAPLTPEWQYVVSGSLVVVVFLVLYRRIETLGRISVLLWTCTIGTIVWIIVGGATHFNPDLAFGYPDGAFEMTPLFFAGLGMASVKTVYSYLGYYNVCHLGAEVLEPEKLIPRSMFVSVAGIALLYIAMSLSIYGVIPWQELARPGHDQPMAYAASIFMERLYGPDLATVATVMILIVAFASLFAVVLGYSRIPYAAALDGSFFKIFARTHPTKHFPHVSLMVICGIALVFATRAKLQDVISAIIAMRCITQFIAQAVGVMVLRSRRPQMRLPFRMWFYPLPALIAIVAWIGIFMSTGQSRLWAAGAIVTGLIAFVIRSYFAQTWPFGPAEPPASEPAAVATPGST